MSELTKALNIIHIHFKANYPEIFAKFPLGVSSHRIHQILQSLPYKLPQEVYELYQFCGGWERETENWDGIFTPWFDLTLRNPTTILEETQDFEAYKVRYIGKPLVPIFGFDRTYLCVVGDFLEEYSSPLIYVSELYQVELDYVNLTSMIQVTAESWQTGVAYIDEKGFVKCDEEKFFGIYRQHNRRLPQMVLDRLREELELAESKPDRLYKIWDSLYENICWLTQCWPDLSIEQFSSESIALIMREINKKEKNSYSHYAQMILAELSHLDP